MKNILYLLLFILIGESCKKSSNNEVIVSPKTSAVAEAAIDTNKIYASWLLVSYAGGLAGGNYVPTVQTILELDADKTAKFYQNSVIVYQDTFILKQGKSITGGGLLPQINFANSSLIKNIDMAKNDTLRLGDEIDDGYTYFYIRVK